MAEKNTILQRINAVRKSIGYVQKDKSVSTGQGSYKAVTHDVVTGMVRQHMIEHGIVCVPTLLRSQLEPKEEGAKQQRYVATYRFDFCNEDDAADKVSIEIESHAMDNADKAPGKAISYAKKYAVLKLFEIETGEDEESRYQTDDFDIVPHVDAMKAAKTLPELQTAYKAAINAATEAKDKSAQKTIIGVKDQRKAELSEPAK